jgi:hypothetical protein
MAVFCVWRKYFFRVTVKGSQQFEYPFRLVGSQVRRYIVFPQHFIGHIPGTGSAVGVAVPDFDGVGRYRHVFHLVIKKSAF